MSVSKNEFRNMFAETIFYHKYAQGNNDSWHNLAIRLVDDVCGTQSGKLHPLLSKDERDYLVEIIRTFKFIPGGRYLYYAGRPAHFWNNCFSGKQEFITDKGLKRFKDVVGSTVNVLSPVSHSFIPAEVKSYGHQDIYDITFMNVRGKSKKTWKVEATYNHRWLLKDGTETINLSIGDIVASTGYEKINGYMDDALIHGMVFADGNGKESKIGFQHQLRLCGDKKGYLSVFEIAGHTVTYPEFANGDPVVYIKSNVNLKELPNTDNVDYISSFIRGWLLLDGHFGEVNQLHTINKSAMEYFIDNCHLDWWTVSGDVLVETKPSNFGERKPLYRVNFKATQEFQGFKVTNIEYKGIEEAYCVEEEKYHLFTLKDGMVTGNCYLLRAEEDSREEWASLTNRAMSALMSGGGIGIDYSRLRPSGRALSRTGGLASGPIPLMYATDNIGTNVMQGGSRRSAIYASLNWQHGDIEEFLRVKNWHEMIIAGAKKEDGSPYTVWDAKQDDFNYKAPLDMTNISVNYDNKFLEEAHQGYAGDGIFEDPILMPDLPEIFLANCKQAMMTGEPGFSFNFGDKENETLRNACTEVTSEDDSDVCNLGSINLGNISSLEEFRNVVTVAAKFLVCGTVRAELPYEKVYQVREKNRRLGLGLMGIHEWLLKRGEKYEVTEELHKWLKVYQDESEASANEHCDRLYLSRPVAYRAIAPTGSIGILAGTTTGIEPLLAVAYKRRYLKDKTRWHYQYVVDSTAETLIQETGVNPDDIETALSLAGDYERRIKFQADIQDYVDMSISSTINLPAWGSKLNNEDRVSEFAGTLAKYAPRLRGFTCYPDGARGGQPLTAMPYEDALKHKGVEFMEHDICELSGKSGVCGA